MTVSTVVITIVVLLIGIGAIVAGFYAEAKSGPKERFYNDDEIKKRNENAGHVVVTPKRHEVEYGVSYFIGAVLAWLNLIGGIVGFFYYAVGEYNRLGKLMPKANWSMVDQIKTAQAQSIIIGLSVLMAGVTLFVIIQLLRGIYKNTLKKAA